MQVNPETGAGTALSDTLEHVKFSSLAWTHDNKVRKLLSPSQASSQ